MTVDTDELMLWLEVQIETGLIHISSRKQSAEIWRTATDQHFKELGTKMIKSSERLKLAEVDERIAKKHEHDIDVLNALVALVKLCQGTKGTSPHLENLETVSGYGI